MGGIVEAFDFKFEGIYFYIRGSWLTDFYQVGKV